MIISRKKYEEDLQKAHQKGMNEVYSKMDHENFHRELDKQYDDLDRRVKAMEKAAQVGKKCSCESAGAHQGKLPI